MISAQTWIQKLKISVKTVTKLYTKALSQWTVKLIIYTVGRRGGGGVEGAGEYLFWNSKILLFKI